jgi:hypothetical protein
VDKDHLVQYKKLVVVTYYCTRDGEMKKTGEIKGFYISDLKKLSPKMSLFLVLDAFEAEK